MTRKREIALALAAAGALTLAVAAPAAGHELPSAYIGASAGILSIPEADDETEGTDTSLFSGGVYGGLHLSDRFGLEAGYLKSAKGDVGRNTGVDYDVSTWHVALVGRVHTSGDLTPFAKVGFHRWEVGVGVTFESTVVRASRSGADLMLGGGLEWAMGESWTCRAEYMYLPYDEDGSDGTAHAFLLGVSYSF